MPRRWCRQFTPHSWRHGFGHAAHSNVRDGSLDVPSELCLPRKLQAQILWQDGFNQVAPFELLATLPALDRQQLAERRERSQVRGACWSCACVFNSVYRLICGHKMQRISRSRAASKLLALPSA